MIDILSTPLSNFRLQLGNKEVLPLMQGGMGVNISTRELALEIARLGGIGHISDAMLPDVTDRLFHTGFTAMKAKLNRAFAGLGIKIALQFDEEAVARATRTYVDSVMSAKKGAGLVFMNVMEKLTMNNP